MTKRKLLTLLAAVAAASMFTITAVAQDQKESKKGHEDRVSGIIDNLNKDTKTLTVRLNKPDVRRQVIYSDQTKITKLNKPGASVDDLKNGTRVICLGKFNDKTQLEATRIDIRLPK